MLCKCILTKEDVNQTVKLFNKANGSMKRRGHAVLADKAYSGNALRNKLKRKGIKTVIPRKSNEKLASDESVKNFV
ncbi:transposase [Symbiopectobacterium purcellii]|uniref:transposase n=1 Tax=Symbiopectobacterium purcellii TaxID=2871826 RepID=UPI003F84744A